MLDIPLKIQFNVLQAQKALCLRFFCSVRVGAIIPIQVSSCSVFLYIYEMGGKILHLSALYSYKHTYIIIAMKHAIPPNASQYLSHGTNFIALLSNMS